MPDRRIHEDELLAHATFVRQLARSLVGDANLAADIEQEAWLAAFERPPRDRARLRAWLATIVRNAARKWHRGERARQRRQRVASRSEMRGEIADSAREATRRLVVRAALDLEEPYRTVVLLRFFEELPPREIARRLDVPVETVRTRIKRALERLRGRLDSEHDGDRRAWCLALIPLAAQKRSPLTTTSTRVLFGLGAAAVLAILVVIAFRRSDVPLAGTVARSTGLGGSGDASDSTRATAGTTDAVSPPGLPSSALGELLVRVRFQEDGSPAAFVRSRITSTRPAFVVGHLMDRRCDTEGLFVAEGLPAGSVLVYLDRLPEPVSATTRAGERVAVTIDLPRGVDAEGTVVDETGRPVSGADVVFSRTKSGTDAGVVVATSNADGRFLVRDISATGFLGATFRGHAPSWMHLVPARTIQTIHYALALRGPGGELSVRVRRPDGSPADGVEASLRIEGDGLIRDADGHVRKRNQTRFAAADAEGRLEIHGLDPGRYSLVIGDRLAAAAALDLDVTAGATREISVDLRRGATVVGVARDPDGAVVPGAMIEARAPGDWNLWTVQRTRTDEQGAFRIDHLDASQGALLLALDDSRGSANAEVPVVDGAQTRWDPVLSRGLVIDGRLEEEGGAPLENWTAVVIPPLRDANGEPCATGSYGGFRPTGTTDASGHFRIWRCPDAPCTLAVRPTDAALDGPVHSFADVRPGIKTTTFRVPRASLPSTFVLGRILTNRTALRGASIALIPADTFAETTRVRVAEDGRYRVGPLPKGRYKIDAHTRSHGDVTLGEVDLADGESRDLGDVSIADPGSIEAVLRREGGGPVGRPNVIVRSGSSEIDTPVVFDGDVARIGPLAPGIYDLAIGGLDDGDVAMTALSVEVEAGVCARRDVEVRTGVARRVSVRFSEGNEAPRRYQFAVLQAADGKLLWWARHSTFDPIETPLAVRLGPGRYSLTVLSEDGRKGRASVEIADLEPAEKPIDILVE